MTGASMPWTRRDAATLLALALGPFVFFWPLFVPGAGRMYFEGGDFIDQFYAFASFEVASFAAGELPLWNPYAYAGSPFWADIQAAVAYPPSLAVVLASAWAWGRLPLVLLEAEAVAHVGMAAVFTYLFARRVLASRPAALVSAVAFAFGGYLTGYPMLQLAVLETSVWLPLALLGVERMVDGPRRGPSPDPLLPFALAMAVLAGHPQTTNFVLYVTVAWFAWRARPWSPWARAWRSVAVLGLAGASALGLSAAGWLPALEFLGLSNRAAADYASLANGFLPRELLGAVLPGVTKWSPLYVGVLPLLLAAGAVWWAAMTRGSAVRSPGPGDPATGAVGGAGGVDGEVPATGIHDAAAPDVEDGGAAGSADDARLAGLARFWLALGVVALLLSLGRHGFAFDVFYRLAPGFDLFRGQERAAFVASFSLAMLAGIGARRMLAGCAVTPGVVARGALGLATAGIVLAVVAPPALATAALRLVLLAGAASLVAVWRSPPRLATNSLAAGRWSIALLALAAIDLYLANGRTNLVPDPPEELAVSPMLAALRDALPQRVENDDRLPRNFGVVHGVESTYGASPLRLQTFEALREGLRPAHEGRWWDLLAVSHVVTWRPSLDVPSEGMVAQGSRETAALLFQLELDRPFAWRVASAEAVADDLEALDRLRAADFDPQSMAVIHAAPGTIAPGRASRVGTLEVLERKPGYIAFETSGDAAGWVVVSEMAYPGWRAWIDRMPAEVWRADVALMAVWVPAGRQHVTMIFRGPRVWAGLVVSAVAWMFLVTIVAGRARARYPRLGPAVRRRRPRGTGEGSKVTG